MGELPYDGVSCQDTGHGSSLFAELPVRRGGAEFLSVAGSMDWRAGGGAAMRCRLELLRRDGTGRDGRTPEWTIRWRRSWCCVR